MVASRGRLIREFTKAMREGNAAIFAGAGLSRASGYVDWKTLISPLAAELGLDMERETDYLKITQYYRNEALNRTSINRTILENFTKETTENENVELIARLPISTYWTTNYDRLIETALERNGRKADVKIDSRQLPNTPTDRDAVLYKMHGDVGHPADAVLTKDDYARYDKTRPLFKTILKGDLISKRFLFLGFSFEDPNLDYILTQLHMLLDENMPEHYCVFRRVQRADYADGNDGNEEYGYQRAKQDLRVRDLLRYGIETVFVERYEEITEILRSLEMMGKRNNVFISGSAVNCDNNVEELAFKLSEALVRKNFRVTSGFGLGIGSTVVNGALSEIFRNKHRRINKYLCLHPFPYRIKDDEMRKTIFTRYRQEMLADTGIAIFLLGNKKNPDNLAKIINAPGCWEEFEIARKNSSIVIPIGSTGFMAREIFEEVKRDIDRYPYLKDFLEILDKETDVDRLVKVVVTIAEKQRDI